MLPVPSSGFVTFLRLQITCVLEFGYIGHMIFFTFLTSKHLQRSLRSDAGFSGRFHVEQKWYFPAATVIRSLADLQLSSGPFSGHMHRKF